MADPRRVLIMAGGTGGHVFPALATADALRAQGVEVEWLGTAAGIEADVVPRAGISLHCIDVRGVRGKGLMKQLLAPFGLLLAIWQAFGVLRRVKPDAVLGMGGFASGPGGLVAWMLRCPLVIHEQNAVAGTTNRILARFASRVLQAFPRAYQGQDRGEVVGNPVRGPILQLMPLEQRIAGRDGALRLLVVGGSLGAKAINELVPRALAKLPAAARPEVWHQTGKRNIDEVVKDYAALGVEGRLVPFIEHMDEAYGWADLVICRAGALTVSELAIAGVASVLVPLPHAIDDHQTANAGFLSEAGAGVRIAQSELDADKLVQLLKELGDREKLLTMARAARALAQPDASERVARVCVEVMK
ncbi:UDP-N-acetylglucosamine--N-acetylmuramyl-(pentapeptide) pyrophosphoryl-undecaprenol N-acetylglucosamine transferase [Marinobacterium zhoushanense]|uniref:UDP-N-acetylglucosamine--N-acetylmuramyl-(pentapeptide) pyrophosphoryl-undecaprenol N-acetylglucosamine transferase n=1 Tax=Marinobacterium zhoushanense TaxID=1679163 RepID=A0ABQ1K909_9GAMM|nr:undecaprenyldiphospho-muramoylpentapeptide beta-N-acetylglucosaminyltransferase [Marinobacterium zhoushanense]GGB87668.1 UDP-N-acetylglucosamine--N-acetylmuramyl-(pentapeptide) pyrophosphoryl-undecaprenol N-acetylglucosamine transferase [Marinobacterium zhoushanense]